MFWPLVYSALIIGIDQLSKHLTRTHMSLHESIPVVGDFFRLTYVENSGAAFGINFRGGPPIFTAAAAVATVLVILYLWKLREKGIAPRLSLALVLGGAVGNLIDRLLSGKVVDFFDFGIDNYRWPVFNVADSSVTVGIFVFLIASFYWRQEAQEERET